ncbi:MAG TPA: ATP-dependent helicase [Thermoplasmata archaeon]
MITKIGDRSSTDQVLSLMHPVVAEWFRSKFGELTEAQAMAVPLIHSRQSVLVSSPTGSGKTLTAFLSILNELIWLSGQGKLEDRIYAVYVSPLKALANDINENLLKPLEEISGLFASKGLEAPEVKVAVRTGDTLPSERQKQARSPPHIFITTPESLSLVLSTPVFSKRFEGVDYVIVDEVHEICDSKRGVALSIALERLQSYCKKELVRIGLSATVAPIEQVAEFLVGLKDGKPRDVNIVEVFGQRDLDLRVLCPASDMTALSFEVVNSKMYDMLNSMIGEHTTTLVFTNTRSGTESVVYKLKERGLEDVGAHHGSLSRETRMDVESDLRQGNLRAVVSSTSLELGIDIGSIDLVVQIGSPKSVAKGLQRVGRSGHQYRGTSRGRIIVFESDDLVECAVLCRAAHQKLIDRVTIPMNSLDVLCQALVGLSIERKWAVSDAFELFRRTYCYRDLSMGQLEGVLRYLGGKDEFEGVYSKLWYDEKEGAFGKKRGSRMIYYLNQGTIPEEADYDVFTERGTPVGSLSEKFVERLSQGDIFVLGGRSYEFIKSKGTKAFVKSASGRKPTVPSWTGELLPRSYDLSVLVAKFRGEMDQQLGCKSDVELTRWLMEDFDVDEGSATTIINYFKEQRIAAKIPSDSRLLIEGYVDGSGNKNAVFHFPYGRRVNDALSRAYAQALSERLKCNIIVSVTDDSFMLSSPKNFALEGIGSLVRSENLEQVLRSAVKGSELFAQRFRHTATRSFMVLRNYKGRELSVARQQLRSSRLLDALSELENFPVMIETYEEILTDVMDLAHAREVLASIESGQRSLEYVPFSKVPSPFAHNVILVGVSDIVLMEDKSMLLRELHRKVLTRVLGEEAVSEYQFQVDVVEEYFAAKFPKVSSKAEILEALRKVGPMNLFREKGESIYSHTDEPFEELRTWSSELLREGKVRSVWIGEDVYVATDDHPLYACMHTREISLRPIEEAILARMSGQPVSQVDLIDALKAPRDEIRDAVRRLESANAIYRSSVKGEVFSYSRAEPLEHPKQECVMDIVERHIAYHAPSTLEDLSYEVGVAESDVDDALRELLSIEAVISGKFVVGEQLQYMLARDYLKIRSANRQVFDRETIRLYGQKKHFDKIGSIEEFFAKFGEAGMIYDIFQRVDRFDMGKFGQLRQEGRILLGRFVRGRLRYVLAEDAPYYLGVFRKDAVNRYEAELLKVVRRLGSGTYQEISEASSFPPNIMRESFDSLDRKGYLLRLYDEAESWSSRNVYVPCELEPVVEGALERVLTNYLRGFGPVTAAQAARYLDIEPDEARAIMMRIGAKAIIVGLEEAEMFVFPEELDAIERVGTPRDVVRILSLYDSYLSDKWTEISSRFDEGWIFPVAYHGKIVGMVEKWLLAGSVEIREIQLDDPQLLGLLLESLDGMMEFYNSLGVDILRVRRVFGVDVQELDKDVSSELISRGYAMANGMLVKGRLVTECFDLSEAISVVLDSQNVAPGQRLGGMEEALARFGGLRSNTEALMRADKFEPLQKLHRKGQVLRGHLVPDRVGYCTREQASLFRSARLSDLNGDQKLVLRIVSDQQPVKRERLLTLSPLGRGDTQEALKALYSSSRLFLDSSLSYVSVGRKRVSRSTAWTAILRDMFRMYGLMTAETLSTLLGHEIRMKEIRKMLRVLEDEGYLVKGYLVRGSGILYWATREAFLSLGKSKFAHNLILSPEDNLTLYLRAGFRSLLPETGRYAVFRGSSLIGSFQGKLTGGKLEVSDLKGEPDCETIIIDYARRLGRALSEKEERRMSDWEIMDFYQRTHPGMRGG